jgi:hypothetical protein
MTLQRCWYVDYGQLDAETRILYYREGRKACREERVRKRTRGSDRCHSLCEMYNDPKKRRVGGWHYNRVASRRPPNTVHRLSQNPVAYYLNSFIARHCASAVISLASLTSSIHSVKVITNRRSDTIFERLSRGMLVSK